MPETKAYLAVDLGATSGRVMIARLSDEGFDLQEVNRFPNEVSTVDGHQRWNTKVLFDYISSGLKKAFKENDDIVSLGVDTWAVDYGLFDADGELIAEPIFYRDERNIGQLDKICERLPKSEIYGIAGIQFLDFNTICQLHGHIHDGSWPSNAKTLLLIPDIFHYYLTGKMSTEYTNATHTQMVDVKHRQWSEKLLSTIDTPKGLMPEIKEAGTVLGNIKEEHQKSWGAVNIPVVLPATHDTGSAVLGTPLEEGWAYISSGTWSLVGIENHEPILTEKSLGYNFTNEGGAYGTNRLLKNVMGMWLLESCRSEWDKDGKSMPYGELMEHINRTDSKDVIGPLIFPDAPEFTNPESMVKAINNFLKRSDQSGVDGEVELSCLIFQSLAFRYAKVISMIEDITGTKIQGIQIVGGGCQNDYLNQCTADATGLPVKAGPVEATAIGNVLVQAITAGQFSDIAQARSFVRENFSFTSYQPKNSDLWEEKRAFYYSLEEI